MLAASRAERAAWPHQTAGNISEVRGLAWASGLTWFYSCMAVKANKPQSKIWGKIIFGDTSTVMLGDIGRIKKAVKITPKTPGQK
jgi:hypothetical protein